MLTFMSTNRPLGGAFMRESTRKSPSVHGVVGRARIYPSVEMFEDFDKSKRSVEGRGRMGVSFLISGGIFVGIMAALAAAIATARVVVKRKQKDVDVSFADLPKPPPKPKAAVKKTMAPGKRKAAVRVATKPPSGIPEERPPEAEGELADAGKLGPIEGFTDGDGKGGGSGQAAAPPPPPPEPPPPPPAPVPAAPPRALIVPVRLMVPELAMRMAPPPPPPPPPARVVVAPPPPPPEPPTSGTSAAVP